MGDLQAPSFSCGVLTYEMDWDGSLMEGYATLSYLHDAPAWIRRG